MKRIMVVDDEPDTQTLFEQRFRREIRSSQVDLRFFFSAEAALDHLTSEGLPLELILSDINMPGMGGLELLRQVKATYPHITMIMVTAYSDPEYYQSAMQHGADGYISKPIDFKALKANLLGL